ncbi:hypothetical protein OIE62_02845 [Streptomyces scopuliridis]|uniref:Uncharacterized protein n=1 Tax=Streptomyces scopuliridis TaxID=452529 RepID=A0ACD4ZYZ7_9ACTN|nr:hypothetical protein [Streptomyces scopuliridis]WSC03441.1 hypothetical protein OG835_38990 [Streptomyces scopuliridis]WSC11264.1 hypothetical protein OIE62_02845 [Streptomyces scopuliridis]
MQDPTTGLVPEYAPDGGPGTPPAPASDGWADDGAAGYHVLSVGCALDLLGARFASLAAPSPSSACGLRTPSRRWTP